MVSCVLNTCLQRFVKVQFCLLRLQSLGMQKPFAKRPRAAPSAHLRSNSERVPSWAAHCGVRNDRNRVAGMLTDIHIAWASEM